MVSVWINALLNSSNAHLRAGRLWPVERIDHDRQQRSGRTEGHRRFGRGAVRENHDYGIDDLRGRDVLPARAAYRERLQYRRLRSSRLQPALQA